MRKVLSLGSLSKLLGDTFSAFQAAFLFKAINIEKASFHFKDYSL